MAKVVNWELSLFDFHCFNEVRFRSHASVDSANDPQLICDSPILGPHRYVISSYGSTSIALPVIICLSDSVTSPYLLIRMHELLSRSMPGLDGAMTTITGPRQRGWWPAASVTCTLCLHWISSRDYLKHIIARRLVNWWPNSSWNYELSLVEIIFLFSVKGVVRIVMYIHICMYSIVLCIVGSQRGRFWIVSVVRSFQAGSSGRCICPPLDVPEREDENGHFPRRNWIQDLLIADWRRIRQDYSQFSVLFIIIILLLCWCEQFGMCGRPPNGIITSHTCMHTYIHTYMHISIIVKKGMKVAGNYHQIFTILTLIS